MEDLNNSLNSPSFVEQMESHSLPSSPSTSMTFQPDNHSPSSSSSSIKKEKIDLGEIKKTPDSHFLHNIIDIKQEESQKNQLLSFSLKPFLNFTTVPSLISLNQKPNNKNTPFIECVVCQDKSSGKHYGQYTCEGCKSFFKRSVRRNLTYQCRSSKNCPIDQYHRNQCQHCRFKKCLRMGMKKEAVQQGRNPTNQIKKNNHHDSKIIPSLNENHSLLQNNSEQKIGPNFLNNYLNQNLFNQCLPMGSSNQNEQNLFDFAAKFVEKIFEFNISVPFFNSLKQDDQILLLKKNWSELLLVAVVQSNLNLENIESKEFNQDNYENFDLEKIIKTYKSIVFRLRDLDLDQEEFSYLKGILIYNSVSEDMDNKELLENYQNVCHTCLKDVSNSKDRDKCLRFGKILLVLSNYWKEVSSNCVLKHILNLMCEQDLNEKIGKSYQSYKNNQFSSISENIYTLMSQNKILSEQLLRPKLANPILTTNPKFNENILKYQNNIFNSYFPANYSNFLLNFRNPFLIPNKTLNQSE
ncbi:unnamed protein product [Brachionus calyciflorus]|uniref:Nuclear receptor n=1 Tax=Brachionus calyciflorus TaxID=104777 RepID=A0A813MGV2_9BILA|nr:unnamed protein product [Brachionus calyciflorus]